MTILILVFKRLLAAFPIYQTRTTRLQDGVTIQQLVANSLGFLFYSSHSGEGIGGRHLAILPTTHLFASDSMRRQNFRNSRAFGIYYRYFRLPYRNLPYTFDEIQGNSLFACLTCLTRKPHLLTCNAYY